MSTAHRQPAPGGIARRAEPLSRDHRSYAPGTHSSASTSRFGCVFCSCLIVVCALAAPAFGDTPDTETGPATSKEFWQMSGSDLVQNLLNNGTCSEAFYELWRRANRHEDAGYKSFLESHYDPEVVVCPQAEGEPPIYLVLYGFLSKRSLFRDEDYDIADPQELFDTIEGSFFKNWEMAAIAAFAHDGKMIQPFGHSTVLEAPGMIADINGDGVVERADHASYSVKAFSRADVLRVAAVRRKPEPLLAVLYNWGKKEWSYRLTDADQDGVFDIELGPEGGGQIKTKVVYKWNKDKRAYVAPQGGDGDHFRLLDARDASEEVERLKRSHLEFPEDQDPVPDEGAWPGTWGRSGKKEEPSPAEVSKPYHYASLKGLSNEEIVRYMVAWGRNVSDLEEEAVIKSHVPPDFWRLPPQAAALALAEANRHPGHRARFRLAVDARDDRKPPGTCSVSFSYASSRSYVAIDDHYFLRADPKGSYLAQAKSSSSGRVSYNILHNRPAYDFRYCELDYSEARHIAHTIWWLNWLRSWPNSGDAHGMFSTADGRGTLVLRSGDGQEHIHVAKSIWADHISVRWIGHYTRDVLLNLAEFLVTIALPEHLGERWSQFEPAYFYDLRAPETGTPRYTDEELTRLHLLTKQFLELFTPDQRLLSHTIVREAARAAGDFAYADLARALRDIHERLPEPEEPPTTRERVSMTDALDETGTETWDARLAERRRERALLFDLFLDSDEKLKEAATLALKKLEAANDAQRLEAWACSDAPGWQWALQGLKGQERERYVAALQWRLSRTEGEWARQVFDEIARTDTQRAAELAKEIAPEKKGDLSVSAFAHLDAINGIPDEAKRVESLIQVVLDPESGWKERGRAIELLVPMEQPLRYPGQEIDDALLALLDPELADDLINISLGAACRALARRGGTDHFDEMYTTLTRIEDGYVYDQVLGALTQIAQRDPQRFNQKLLSLLRPHLERTNRMISGILWAIWAADLRELKPDLERIATSSPEDYEDPHAHSFGGGVTPIEGRLHLARQIVAVWNEEDPATRTKLLLAMGFESLGPGAAPERLAQWDRQLSDAAKSLSAEQAKDVDDFIKWYEKEHIAKDENPGYRKRRMEFSERARRRLGL